MLSYGVVVESYRLSPMQQGMLFHGLTAGTRGADAGARGGAPGLGMDMLPGVDINQLVCAPEEDLDIGALTAAFDKVIARHPILRTAFRWRDLKEPLQDVYREVCLPVERRDLRELKGAERESAFLTLLDADRRRGIDLERPPLMRLTLVHVEDRRYRIVWTFPHAYLDGRSFYTVLTEVFTFYDAIRAGRSVDLPTPRPFRDYIEWLSAKDWSSSQAFWRGLLAGASAPTPIPIEHTGDREARRTINEMAIRKRLSIRLSDALRLKASEHGLTLNNVLQGAWAILLARYSGQRDVIFGATRACRRGGLQGAESMVGLIINTLPVRMRYEAETTVLDALRDLRTQWVAMRDHEHMPLAEVTRLCDRGSEHTLFNSIMVAENYNWKDALIAEGEAWRRRPVEIYERTNYPLTLLVDLGREIEILAQYDGRRYSHAAVERLLGHLAILCDAMACGFEQRIDDLPILTPEERAGLVPMRRGVARRSQGGSCLHELFEAQALRTPDSWAVEDTEGSLSYKELDERSNKLARYLLSSGVNPGDRVGLCEAKCIDVAVAMLGVLKAGCAYVPLDPAYPPERLALMASDAGLSVVLTSERRMSRLAKVGASLCLLDKQRAKIEAESAAPPVLPKPVTAEDVAYVIYTSGSTGNPKGVVVQHKSCVRHTLTFADEFHVGPGDRFAQFASISFDVVGLEVYPTWARGGTVVMRPEDVVEPRSLERWMASAGITCAALTTALWHEWVSALEASGGAPPACLRLLCVGGEKMSRAAFDAWNQARSEHVRCVNIYGPTEATIYITYFDPKKEAPLPPNADVPIGRPYPGARLYVLDAQGRPVPAGVPGELYLGGAQVAMGYLNRPELTAERFVEMAVAPGERLYKTGDRVRYMDDGQLQYLGRADRQVKIRGYRIELPEIESALDKHPDVRLCAVDVIERSPTDKRLVAYVAGTPALTAEGLRAYLKEILPPYMVPATFVLSNALPLTPNGKVDRRSLPRALDDKPADKPANASPTTFIEKLLADLYCEVLGVPKVGANESFFDLGGHSLLMLRIIDRAAHAGLRITPDQLFQHPSVAELASVVTMNNTSSTCAALRGADPWSSLVPLRKTGKRRPLFLVHTTPGDIFCYARLVAELGPDQPVYGFQARGLRKIEESHTSIEEMAAYYVEIMRAQQKEGPYFIGGWCFGGLVAVEMGAQLLRAGAQVGAVMVMDTPAPRPATLFHKYYVDRLRSFVAMGPSGQARVLREKLEIRRGQGVRSMKEALAVEIFDGPLANRGAVSATNLVAYRRYTMDQFPGKLSLFNATEPLRGRIYDKYMGWRALCEGLELFEIGTVHEKILHDPHVKVLARSLRQVMDREGASAPSVEDDDPASGPVSPPTLPSRLFPARVEPAPPIAVAQVRIA